MQRQGTTRHADLIGYDQIARSARWRVLQNRAGSDFLEVAKVTRDTKLDECMIVSRG
jgi:hypothetical protein